MQQELFSNQKSWQGFLFFSFSTKRWVYEAACKHNRLTSQAHPYNGAAEHGVDDGKCERAPHNRFPQARVRAAAAGAVVHRRQHGCIGDAESH